MSDDRPTSVTLIAIVNMVIAALGILNALCCGLAFIGAEVAFSVPAPNQGDLNMVALREFWLNFRSQLPWFTGYVVVTLLLSLVLNGLLILSAIGLLALEQWGRWLVLACAITIIITQLVEMVLTIGVINPAADQATLDMNNFIRQRTGRPLPAQSPTLGVPIFNSLATIAWGLGNLGYSVAIIVVMLLPSIAFAFTGEGRWAPRRLRRDRDEARPRRRRADADDDRDNYDLRSMDDDPSLY